MFLVNDKRIRPNLPVITLSSFQLANSSPQRLTAMGLLTIIRKNRQKEKEMRLLFL
jgi:hypothetical protein